MARGSPANQAGTALDAALRSLFRALQDRPLPATLRSTLEQLDSGTEAPARKRS